MRRTGLSKPSVWRWQERYHEAGVDGLLRDKTRPSRVPPLPGQGRRGDPAHPGGAAARRGDPLDRARDGRASGVSPAKVHEIWQDPGLAPHRVRRFKLSTDPAFAEKLEDVVGLYVDPPRMRSSCRSTRSRRSRRSTAPSRACR